MTRLATLLSEAKGDIAAARYTVVLDNEDGLWKELVEVDGGHGTGRTGTSWRFLWTLHGSAGILIEQNHVKE